MSPSNAPLAGVKVSDAEYVPFDDVLTANPDGGVTVTFAVKFSPKYSICPGTPATPHTVSVDISLRYSYTTKAGGGIPVPLSGTVVVVPAVGSLCVMTSPAEWLPAALGLYVTVMVVEPLAATENDVLFALKYALSVPFVATAVTDSAAVPVFATVTSIVFVPPTATSPNASAVGGFGVNPIVGEPDEVPSSHVISMELM